MRVVRLAAELGDDEARRRLELGLASLHERAAAGDEHRGAARGLRGRQAERHDHPGRAAGRGDPGAPGTQIAAFGAANAEHRTTGNAAQIGGSSRACRRAADHALRSAPH